MTKFKIFNKPDQSNQSQAPTLEQLTAQLGAVNQTLATFGPAVGDLEDRIKAANTEIQSLKTQVGSIVEDVEKAVSDALESFEERLPQEAAKVSTTRLASNGHEPLDLTKRADEQPQIKEYTKEEIAAMEPAQRFRVNSDVIAKRAKIKD